MVRSSPRTRVRVRLLVAILALGALVGTPDAARGQVSDAAPVRVMVVPAFDGEWKLQIAAALAVRERLESRSKATGSDLRVVPSDSVRFVLERRRVASDAPLSLPALLSLAATVNAEAVVSGVATSTGRGVRLQASLIFPGSPGQTSYLPAVERATIAAAVDSVAAQIVQALGESQRSKERPPVLDSTITAWLLYGGDPALPPRAQLIAETRRSIAADPGQATPWLRLLSLYDDMSEPDSVLRIARQAGAVLEGAERGLVAQFVLSQGNRFFQAAQRTKARDDYLRAFPYLRLADSLGGGSMISARSRLLMGASTLELGRALIQAASLRHSCQMTKQAQTDLRAAGAFLATGRSANPLLVGQLLRSHAHVATYADSVERANCAEAPG